MDPTPAEATVGGGSVPLGASRWHAVTARATKAMAVANAATSFEGAGAGVTDGWTVALVGTFTGYVGV